MNHSFLSILSIIVFLTLFFPCHFIYLTLSWRYKTELLLSTPNNCLSGMPVTIFSYLIEGPMKPNLIHMPYFLHKLEPGPQTISSSQDRGWSIMLFSIHIHITFLGWTLPVLVIQSRGEEVLLNLWKTTSYIYVVLHYFDAAIVMKLCDYCNIYKLQRSEILFSAC